MKTLYLIDGHAQFFRAYHAIRSRMTSPVTGEPTNATFGFVGMLLKTLREYRPDYLAVAIDVSGDRETFRSELYPAYKATRDAPPEDLGPQIERCIAILNELGIPTIGIEGFEADDVLATLTTRLTTDNRELKIRLVSKDKDLQQLLDDNRVEMFDVHTEALLDVAKLHEEKGITPAQVIDMLALMGDTVDNIPGVPGIGPKTAAQLIAEYGSIEGILAELDKPDSRIKGKRAENIRAAAPNLPLSRQLVQLRHDAPVSLDLTDADIHSFRLARLDPILKELGFNRYQQELKALLSNADNPAAQQPTSTSHSFGGLFDMPPDTPATSNNTDNYRCIRTRAELTDLVAELRRADCIAIDTETTAIRPRRADLCGISISTKPGHAVYIPVRSPEPDTHLDESTVLDLLRPILEDPSLPKCGHNLKYDLIVLRRAGIHLRGLAFDSMIASYLIDASRSSHSLDNLALALLNHTCIPISDLIGTGKQQKRFDEVPLDAASTYAAEDADISLRLRNAMLPEIQSGKLESLFRDVEMPLVDVLAELEWNGILVDPDELDRQTVRLEERIAQLREEIQNASPIPFNPDSPKQLSAVLFNKPDAPEPGLGLKPVKRTKTGYSTDVEVLEKLAADPGITTPVPRLIVEHRQLSKLVGTYLRALKDEINPETHRIHASFNQTVAATGRLSSSDPNLQNIPIRTDIGREIRRAFIAPEGSVLISADYSQIELRLLAHLSRDPALIEAFHNDADIHTSVAAQIHNVPPGEVTREQRNGAKMVNFGIVYGITPYGLARRLNIPNDEASAIIDGYKRRFAGITTFLQECTEQARTHGFVETILHRRRPITDIDSNQPNRRALAERMAINSVVQGSAADLIKLAMVQIHALLEGAQHNPAHPELRAVKMLLQIHDELVFEAPENSAPAARDCIVELMQSAMQLDVPLRADAAIGRSWFEGK